MTTRCHRRGRAFCALVLLIAALVIAGGASRAEEPVTVFAAASLTAAIERLNEIHSERTGETMRLVFAASSTLARQIEAGAPADIFISANRQWMDALVDDGSVDPASEITPIGNMLVLIATRADRREYMVIEAGLDMAGYLGDGNRLAIGEPESVPAGMYARQALESLGMWASMEPRLAPVTDVRAALALVERGQAPLGIVYATDAMIADQVDIVGRFPPESHDAIVYPFAIVAGRERPAVSRVFEFLTGSDAAPVYEAHGFSLNDRPMDEAHR